MTVFDNRHFQLPALLFAASWLLATPVRGQDIRSVADSVACRCSLEVRHVVSLSDVDGRAGLGPPIAIHQTSDGKYLVVPATRPGALLLFGTDGVYERQVARIGQGPSELASILAVQSGTADSTVVLDVGNGRVAVLDGDYRVARTARLSVGGGWFGMLPGGEVLILTGIPRDRGTPRLRLFSNDMTPLRFFMPVLDAPDTRSARRRMFVASNGLIAVAHNSEYTVEIWNTAGEHIQTVSRDPAWFSHGQEWDGSRDGPAPLLETPRIDASGRLWTVSHVADPEWKRAVPDVETPLGVGLVVGPESVSRLQDSVVEVIDLRTGLLLASIRIDARVDFISDDGTAAAYREDTMGIPSIDVWKFVLHLP